MNDKPPQLFIEQAADTLQATEVVFYIASSVAILFYFVPAYRRFRTRALLLIVISHALDLVVTILDKTIGQNSSEDLDGFWGYFFCRQLVWIAVIILGTIGLLLFVRDYARLASATQPDSSPTSSIPNTGGTANDDNRNG